MVKLIALNNAFTYFIEVNQTLNFTKILKIPDVCTVKKKHFSPTLPKRLYWPNPSFDCFPTLITYKLDFDLHVLRFWTSLPRQFLRYQRLKSVTAGSRRSTNQVVQYVCKYIINFLRLTSIVINDRPDVDLQSSTDAVMDLQILEQTKFQRILLLVIYHMRFPDQTLSRVWGALS